jgi:hypothetical protein
VTAAHNHHARIVHGALIAALIATGCKKDTKKGDDPAAGGVTVASTQGAGTSTQTATVLESLPATWSFSAVKTLSYFAGGGSEALTIGKSGEASFTLSDVRGYAWSWGEDDPLASLAVGGTPGESESGGIVVNVSPPDGPHAFWLVFEDRIARNVETAEAEATDSGASFTMLSLETGTSGEARVLGATPTHLFLRIDESVVIGAFAGAKLSVTLLDWKALRVVSDIGMPFAAGPTALEGEFWLATLARVYLISRAGESWSTQSTTWTLPTTLGEPKGLGLRLQTPGRFAAQGSVLLWSDKGFFSTKDGSEEAALAFERDIRPLTDKYCVSCHGAASDTSWNEAHTAAGWQGAMRGRIALALEERRMPLPGSPAADAMTEEERVTLIAFARGTALPSAEAEEVEEEAVVTSDPVEEAAPVEDTVWDSQVRSIMQARCVSCHAPWVNRETVLASGSPIVSRVSNATMPPSSSSEGQAMTQAERTALIDWVNSQ